MERQTSGALGLQASTQSSSQGRRKDATVYELESSRDERFILKEQDCPERLGFAFANAKKWCILTCVFAVQSSMNYNASVYGNAIKPMQEKFGVSAQTGRIGQMAFLVAYAFGCELWAPWSEEIGRRKVLQWSLGLVNLWQIPCALLAM